jgi:FkbM family methyltransferase
VNGSCFKNNNMSEINLGDFFSNCKSALDIGSNIGGMAERMILCGVTEVHLFEPAPQIMDHARRLEAEYPDAKVVFNTLGVSDCEGELKNVQLMNCWTLQGEGQDIGYPVSPGALELQPTPFDMKFTTVDKYVTDNGMSSLDILKIDVEGYEPRVLRGARETIARFKPKIMMELSMYVGPIGEDVGSFIRDFLALPYKWFRYDGLPIDSTNALDLFPFHSSYDIFGTPA